METKPRKYEKEKLEDSITNISKMLYNTPTQLPKLSRLEKSVIRGEVPVKEYSYTPKVVHERSSSFRYPSPDGSSIVNLPKLPFGVHSHYNTGYDRGQFSRTHFLNYDSIDSKEKYMLQKQALLSYKKSGSPQMLSIDRDFGRLEYTSKGGKLVCNKNLSVIEAYEKERRRIRRKLNYPQTFRHFRKKLVN